MPYEPTTNFIDTNNEDLGKKFVTKDYLFTVYESIIRNNNLTITPALWCWGNNSSGVLGTDGSPNRSTPVTTFAGGTNWKQVSCGNFHTAAIKTDGSLWVWGSGGTGRLGTNTFFDKDTPVTTFAGGNDWKQVSCGGVHTAAIKTDGSLWVWGDNADGQLGINDSIFADKNTPVTTFAGGNNWKQVSCGTDHTAAIKADGSLWVWGSGGSGRLGTNLTASRSSPVTTFAGGTDWKQVSCGSIHTAAIKTDGSLWVWGDGASGRLGTNNTVDKYTPVTTFAGGNDWKQVSSGVDHTMAIKTDGTLWGWGYGFSGKLGTNNSNSPLTPVTTFAGGNNWKQVSCGSGHTMAIKTDGTLWGWGDGANGRLGTNSTVDKSTPVTTFAGGGSWKQISCGNGFTFAIKSDNYI